MERRTTRLGSNKMRLSDAPSRDLWLRTVLPGTWLPCGTTVSRRCRSPSGQLQWQSLLLGPDGNPSSPRVCACEAQPRTPHPTGLGYPAPAKLSLCPTSVTPLEAPLTGQDPSRISEVWGTGIGIHSQFRERMITCPDAAQRTRVRALR